MCASVNRILTLGYPNKVLDPLLYATYNNYMKPQELKKIREQLGLTQAQLAELVGIAPNSIARQERGEIGIREPLARLLRMIALNPEKKSGGE
jgi:DNA-binding transcriptional regulator YiaG